jgi:hypothetical protein
VDITRREILKLGGLGAAATILPAALRQSAAGFDDATASPIDRRYLKHGLDVLCGAHTTDAFYTGHNGAAVLSAYYFCKEEVLEAGCADVIKQGLDCHYPLARDPFPQEPVVADGVAQLLAALEPGIDALCREGHSVIFLSLAARALHDLPEAVTKARLASLHRTIAALEPKRRGTGGLEIPATPHGFAEFVLEEFLASTEGGPGQGYSGHLLTHGRAILDLRLLGYESFAAKCLNAFMLAVRNARPRSAAKAWKEARPEVAFVRPESKAYWKRRLSADDIELGHLFKYPYGFFGLRRHSRNRDLNEVCTANSHRLFRS